MASEKILHVTAENWKPEVLDSPVPVLVDFWAEWCGPCRALAPVLDELAVEMEGKLRVAKVDVDSQSELAAQFGIRSIPTMLVLKGGVVQQQFVGAVGKAALKAKLAAYLAP